MDKKDNLYYYNIFSNTPQDARKPILAGRLKGKTDINPMWRIKMLTEVYGMCGIGWKTVITKQWLEQGADGQVSAFVNLELYVKVDGVWSDAIIGNGGDKFITKETSKFSQKETSELSPKESFVLYQDDDCYKKAFTDALSMCCKLLGFSADIYYEEGFNKTDYISKDTEVPPEVNNSYKVAKKGVLTEKQYEVFMTQEPKSLNKIFNTLKQNYEIKEEWLKNLEKRANS